MATANKRILSVSINQVRSLATSDNSIVMHRQRVAQVCLVGLVNSINELTTKINYVLNDFTAQPLAVILWKNNGGGNSGDNESQQQQQPRGVINVPVIMEQTYVKVIGQPRKDSEGGVYIVALNIQPITNLNELTIHLIETIYHAKELKKKKTQVLYESKNGITNGVTSTSNGGGGGQMNTGQNSSGLSQIQTMILNLIKDNQSDIGISFDEICESLKSAKKETIKQAVDFLLNEGHTYESLDDTHYKSSE